MNLSNKITIGRMFLIPFFLAVLTLPLQYKSLIAFSIGLVFFIGDFLDGHLARKRNEITDLGKFLDPMADKTIVIIALVYLTIVKTVPLWIASIIIIRELGFFVFRIVLRQNNKNLESSSLGKLKTTIQSVSIGLILINKAYFLNLIYLALILTIISGIDYLFKLRKQNKALL